MLAALGLYSVISYSVTQRTREIGVRMALGAQREEILGLLLRRGMVLTSAGLLAEAGLTLVLSRTVPLMPANSSALASSGSFLGRSGGESLIYLAAAVFLAGIAAMATYIPARRATRVDPMVALRYE